MKQLLNTLNSVTAFIAAVTLVFIILITSIDINCFDRSFYQSEYKQLDTAQELGMTENDLFLATNTLLDYLQDKRDDIDVSVSVKGSEGPAFNSKEASHMVDVRGLYHFAMILRNICMILFVVSIIYLIVRLKKDMLTLFSISFMKSAVLIAVFMSMLAGWAFVDFDAFWTTFHHIAFRNDLWLLNPATDLMINLFPSDFFFQLVFRIVAVFGTSFIAIFAGCYLYLRSQLKKMHEELLYDQDE